MNATFVYWMITNLFCLEHGNRIGFADCAVLDESIPKAVAVEFGGRQHLNKWRQYEQRPQKHQHSHDIPLQNDKRHCWHELSGDEDLESTD